MKIPPLFTLTLPLLFIVVFFFINTSVFADCNALNHQAHQAYKSKDAKKLESLVNISIRSCTGDYIKDLTARVLFDQSEQMEGEQKLKAIQKAIEYAPLDTGVAWEARELLGDLLHQESAYQHAFRAYDKALNIIGYESENKSNRTNYKEAPSAKRILSLHKKAQRERLLADTFIPSNRAGNGVGGVEIIGYKGTCITEVAVPISFATNSSELKPSQNLYIQQLKEMLNKYKQPQITIVGHADERGGARVNLPLSLDRAESVKKYLMQYGYSEQHLKVDGKGAKEHFETPDYYEMNKIKRYRLDRRVEILLPKSACMRN